ncbi:MAG: DNA polymerase III subunit delta' [Chloroflexota bacterium]|nr:DNA polymerase III subunit delta' [Chloroflexota bacterium]
MWTTIGHEWAVDYLRGAIKSQHISHAYLFTGPANIGKTHLAREMAAALNCLGDVPPCGTCSACIKTERGTHPDVTIVEPEGGRLKIDQVRELQHTLSLSPVEGRWRVCIITDFQKATTEAANALLKSLEEPPSRVVLLLTATDADLLLPTIVSRCQVLALRPVPLARLEKALRERLNGDEERARLIARLSAGQVGWALSAIEEGNRLEKRREHMETLLELLGQGRAARIQAAERLSKAGDLVEIIKLWQGWWRDLLLVSSNCEDLVVNIDFLDSLRQIAQQYAFVEAEAAVRDLEATLEQLDRNVNARLALEVLLLGWHQVALN